MASADVKVEPMKMKIMGMNVFPLMKSVFSMMNRTEEKRRQTLVKMNAPKPEQPVLDYYDCKKETPYEIEEVLQDKVWNVSYKAENMMSRNKKMSKMFFGDPEKPEYQQKLLSAAKVYGEDAVETAKKDIEYTIKQQKKTTWTDEEKVEMPMKLNMVVIKLNTGGLALYAPVKLHKEDAPHLIADWLASLGPVEWLVCASSAHTMCIGDAIASYPEAKVVGSEFGQEKLKFAKMLKKDKFDFVVDKPSELQELNDMTKEAGLEFVNIDGDAVNAVLVCAHKEVMAECDIIYGHHDGGFLTLTEKQFREFKPEDTGLRLFKYNLLDKPNSPLGFLPNYRFWMMDPESMGKMFAWNVPSKEDRKKMAESLRKANALQFNKGVGIHINPMSAEDFRKSIDVCWNWLDGEPLVQQN